MTEEKTVMERNANENEVMDGATEETKEEESAREG